MKKVSRRQCLTMCHPELVSGSSLCHLTTRSWNKFRMTPVSCVCRAWYSFVYWLTPCR